MSPEELLLRELEHECKSALSRALSHLSSAIRSAPDSTTHEELVRIEFNLENIMERI